MKHSRSTLRVRRIPSPASCSLPTERAPGGSPITSGVISRRGSSRLAEFERELVGVTPDFRVEHLRRMRIALVAQNVALAHELEAGRGHLLLHRLFIDAMQGVGVACTRAGLGS